MRYRHVNPQKQSFPIRNDILARVAASFFADRFAHIDDVPAQVLPDGSQCYHCNIENDRDIVRQICMAVLGFSPADEEGSKRPLQTMPLRPSNAKTGTEQNLGYQLRLHGLPQRTLYCQRSLPRLHCPPLPG